MVGKEGGRRQGHSQPNGMADSEEEPGRQTWLASSDSARCSAVISEHVACNVQKGSLSCQYAFFPVRTKRLAAGPWDQYVEYAGDTPYSFQGRQVEHGGRRL